MHSLTGRGCGRAVMGIACNGGEGLSGCALLSKRCRLRNRQPPSSGKRARRCLPPRVKRNGAATARRRCAAPQNANAVRLVSARTGQPDRRARFDTHPRQYIGRVLLPVHIICPGAVVVHDAHHVGLVEKIGLQLAGLVGPDVSVSNSRRAQAMMGVPTTPAW